MENDPPRKDCIEHGGPHRCYHCARGDTRKCIYMCELDFLSYGIMDSEAIGRMLQLHQNPRKHYWLTIGNKRYYVTEESFGQTDNQQVDNGSTT